MIDERLIDEDVSACILVSRVSVSVAVLSLRLS